MAPARGDAAAYFAAVYLGLRMKLRVGWPRASGFEACLRPTRLPALRPGRQDQAVPLQPNPRTEEVSRTPEPVADPTETLLSVEKMGKSSPSSTLTSKIMIEPS